MKQSFRQPCCALLRFQLMLFFLFITTLLSGCDNSKRLPDSTAEEDGVWGVGIPSNVMVVHAVEQHGTNWCWAASAQMALGTQSVEITQEEIVHRIFGKLVDSPGGVPHFFGLIGQYSTKEGIKQVTCEFGTGPPNLDFLIESLQQNRPVILAYSNPGNNIGHAVVATAAICRDTSSGRELIKIIIRDPNPGTGKRTLDSAEYKNVMFYATYKATQVKH